MAPVALVALEGVAFARALQERGFDFFTGVPCSLVASLIAALEGDPRALYLPELREDAALGLAAGAFLGGRRPVVIMQNSGLGVCLNALASLQGLYGLGCLLIVTWRGEGGRDAPEHLLMGRAMGRLLDAVELPWRLLEPARHAADLDWAAGLLAARPGPVALVVRRGSLQ